jgi:hypothetical protein
MVKEDVLSKATLASTSPHFLQAVDLTVLTHTECQSFVGHSMSRMSVYIALKRALRVPESVSIYYNGHYIPKRIYYGMRAAAVSATRAEPPCPLFYALNASTPFMTRMRLPHPVHAYPSMEYPLHWPLAHLAPFQHFPVATAAGGSGGSGSWTGAGMEMHKNRPLRWVFALTSAHSDYDELTKAAVSSALLHGAVRADRPAFRLSLSHAHRSRRSACFMACRAHCRSGWSAWESA